jgi:hypothetical protein
MAGLEEGAAGELADARGELDQLGDGGQGQLLGPQRDHVVLHQECHATCGRARGGERGSLIYAQERDVFFPISYHWFKIW